MCSADLPGLSGTVSTAGDVRDATIGMIPPATGTSSSRAIECTFTNTPKNVTAVWVKTDGSSALAGSEWTLTGPSGAASVQLQVTDCAESDAAACTGPDKDPAAGRFEVRDLPFGEYTLMETVAPPGFVLDDTPYAFSPANGTLRIDFGSILNERALGTVIWQKVDAATEPTHLAGSEWKIVGPAPASTEFAVIDCVGPDQPTAAVCAVDQDQRGGYFEVTGLAWGSYQLIETRAPAGMVAKNYEA